MLQGLNWEQCNSLRAELTEHDMIQPLLVLISFVCGISRENACERHAMLRYSSQFLRKGLRKVCREFFQIVLDYCIDVNWTDPLVQGQGIHKAVEGGYLQQCFRVPFDHSQ